MAQDWNRDFSSFIRFRKGQRLFLAWSLLVKWQRRGSSLNPIINEVFWFTNCKHRPLLSSWDVYHFLHHNIIYRVKHNNFKLRFLIDPDVYDEERLFLNSISMRCVVYYDKTHVMLNKLMEQTTRFCHE